MPNTHAGWFRLVAVAEAFSWAGLLLGMVFKYGFDLPLGVTIFGWIHGLVFTAYCVTSLVACGPLRWKFSVLVLALVASIPPFASVAFERWAARRGHLTLGDPAEPTLWRRLSTGVRELN